MPIQGGREERAPLAIRTEKIGRYTKAITNYTEDVQGNLAKTIDERGSEEIGIIKKFD